MAKKKPTRPAPKSVRCGHCNAVVAARLSSGLLSPRNGSQLRHSPPLAPRLTCGRCGRATILLTAAP